MKQNKVIQVILDKFCKKPTRIEFSVEGKPPKKTKPSLWSKDNKQIESVFKLRQKAYETSKEKGLEEEFHDPVKLTLTIYDYNPIIRKDKEDYLGDLDGLVGGVYDALQPSPPDGENGLDVDPKFKEENGINHKNALIIGDDAQISTTVSSKRKINKNEKPYYTVLIEKDYDFNGC